MKKLILLTVLAASLFLVGQAQSHDLWTAAENPTAGQPLTVVLGYGHGYPRPEAIAPERQSIFYPLEIIDAKGQKIPTKQGDVNFRFVTEKPIAKGSYLIASGYKPTFWTNTPSGSTNKGKNESPGATSCERWSRYTKGVVNIEGAADDYVTKPTGAKFEIVPLVNPAKVKVGGDVPFQVLYDGAPLPRVEVKGLFQGNTHTSEGVYNYYAKTNKEGKGVYQVLTPGLQYLIVENIVPFPDQNVCDKEASDATLTFFIGE
ncbi:MAG: DUF4198 domain-containing protein [Deltaproteobacteria bacterium]|jgi:uncharacterized GH25 family protein|nr:DUF4198 domain-containing protein [Deltaproteobacteria bacterium]